MEKDSFPLRTYGLFPKAASRQTTTRGRKQRRGTILTDTPEAQKKAKKGTKGKSATKKRKSPQTQKKINVDSSEDDDTFCIVCCEPYLNSRPNENWVQCVICNNGSHEECTKMKPVYICQKFYSDDSDSSLYILCHQLSTIYFEMSETTLNRVDILDISQRGPLPEFFKSVRTWISHFLFINS